MTRRTGIDAAGPRQQGFGDRDKKDESWTSESGGLGDVGGEDEDAEFEDDEFEDDESVTDEDEA